MIAVLYFEMEAQGYLYKTWSGTSWDNLAGKEGRGGQTESLGRRSAGLAKDAAALGMDPLRPQGLVLVKVQSSHWIVLVR